MEVLSKFVMEFSCHSVRNFCLAVLKSVFILHFCSVVNFIREISPYLISSLWCAACMCLTAYGFETWLTRVWFVSIAVCVCVCVCVCVWERERDCSRIQKLELLIWRGIYSAPTQLITYIFRLICNYDQADYRKGHEVFTVAVGWDLELQEYCYIEIQTIYSLRNNIYEIYRIMRV